MAVAILMPKLGLTMTEGLVAKWYKNEGDTVKPGELLFEVETDKLTNEVEADAEGVLLKIVAKEGTSVPCTQPVGYIGAPGEAFIDEQAPVPAKLEASKAVQSAKPQETVLATPAAKALANQKGINIGSVTASGPNDSVVLRDVEAHRGTSNILATPAAKSLAKSRGFNISDIPATGPNGSVVLRDVEAYIPEQGRKASPTAQKIAAELGIDISAMRGTDRVMAADVLRFASDGEAHKPQAQVQFSAMRRTIAKRMLESWQSSPRVWYEMSVDATNMLKLRETLKKPFEERGLKLTFNHIIMLAVTRALIEYPELNASLSGDMLTLHPSINLGLAVGVDGGLVVPNLKNCERLSLLQISQGIEELITLSREGKLTLDDMSGGTFTITNLGMYKMRSFSPIINQPELAILGVAAIFDTPVAIEGRVEIRPLMNLELVADHRVIDGVLAAKFMQRIASLLEEPSLLIM